MFLSLFLTLFLSISQQTFKKKTAIFLYQQHLHIHLQIISIHGINVVSNDLLLKKRLKQMPIHKKKTHAKACHTFHMPYKHSFILSIYLYINSLYIIHYVFSLNDSLRYFPLFLSSSTHSLLKALNHSIHLALISFILFFSLII